MAAVARLGDPISHGGFITGASTKLILNNLGVARVTDTVNCAIHGAQTLTTGNPNWIADNGQPVARVGSLCSCGAVVTAGSPNVESNA